MEVTVDIAGGGEHRLEADGATYAELLARIDLTPQEVAVLIDGQPVPEDQPATAEHVRVIRLVAGG